MVKDPANFAKHGIDPLSVPAMAAVQLQDELEALYKRLQQAERRCDAIMQQLEYRREVFAHRARRAAEELRKDPGFAAAVPTPELALVDQNYIPRLNCRQRRLSSRNHRRPTSVRQAWRKPRPKLPEPDRCRRRIRRQKTRSAMRPPRCRQTLQLPPIG